MDKAVYNQTIGKVYKHEINQAMMHLSHLQFAKELPEPLLILLAASSERYQISKNTLITSQGEKCNQLYLIKRGLVKIVRQITFLPKACYSKMTEEDGSERLI